MQKPRTRDRTRIKLRVPVQLLKPDCRSIIEGIKQVIFISDMKGRIIYLNRYGKSLIRRLTGEELIGKSFVNFIAPEYLPFCRRLLTRIKKGEDIEPYEIVLIGKNGRRFPWYVTQSVIYNGKKSIGAFGIAIDISDRYERESQLLLKMKEVSALNAVAQVLTQPYDLDTLLRNTVDKVLEITGAEAGGICLLDEKQQVLILRAHRGLTPKILAASTAMNVGEGISGKVVETGKPIVFDDLAVQRQLNRPLLVREGFRSGAVVPITLWGKAIGVFNVLTRKARRYMPGEIDLLVNIGKELGIAIENSYLLHARDEEISRLNALNQISRIISSEISLDSLLDRVYEQVKTILPPDNFCITLYNVHTNLFDVLLKYEKGKKQQRYSFPSDCGLSSRVFFEKKAILTTDYLAECKNQGVGPFGPPTKAWLGVPIVEKGKAIGCIYMYDYEKGEVFGNDDLELLTTIAGQTAVVIENVRQYKMLRERVEELELLFEVGQSVVSVLDLDTVLNQILEMLRKKFGHEKCGILLIDDKTKELYIKARTFPVTSRARKAVAKLGVNGITGHVAQTGLTYYAPDVRKDRYYLSLSTNSRSEVAIPLKIGERVIGVLNIEADVLDAFSDDDIKMLESISNQAAIAIDNARLYESLEQSYFNTIRTLVSAMEAKDAYTSGHSERVRELSLAIARRLGLSSEDTKTISYAGHLHDIGKIGISDSLLSKVEPLSEAEFDKIRLHPIIGHNMIKHLDFLGEVSKIIRHEHERYDGDGYPDQLKGDNIPPGARIMAVADAYDAMTTDRPYRKALAKKEAIRRLKEGAGTQFDPVIVRHIMAVVNRQGGKRKSKNEQ